MADTDRNTTFGMADQSLSGILMSKLDDETPKERLERVQELEYQGLPAIMDVKK